eukprot:scaffold220478_cov23-Tisochrysis_lutea.AAC.2
MRLLSSPCTSSSSPSSGPYTACATCGWATIPPVATPRCFSSLSTYRCEGASPAERGGTTTASYSICANDLSLLPGISWPRSMCSCSRTGRTRRQTRVSVGRAIRAAASPSPASSRWRTALTFSSSAAPMEASVIT